MNYLIRSLKIEELPQLIDLCERHALYEKAEYSKTAKEEKLKTLLFADKPALYCMVVSAHQKLVGYASYTFDCSTWDAQFFLYLDCLYLEPEFRSQGIGEIIFAKLKFIAQSNNCVNIQCQTPVFNTRAIKFYNRIGGMEKEKSRFVFPLI